MSASRRSRQIIDREVQYSLMRKVIIHWLLLLGANAGVMMFWIFFIDSPLESAQSNFQVFARYYTPLFIISVAILPVFILDTAKLSNRFTGPVLRLRKALNELASGREVEKLKFRDNDFWQTMAEDFNTALDNIAAKDPHRSTAEANLTPTQSA